MGKAVYTTIRDGASEWGELILPAEPRARRGGLRTVMFGSTTAGHLVLETLLRFDRSHPGKMDIRAVATDDTHDPRARIGLRKRIWKHYSPEERLRLMDRMIQGTVSEGIPCYTGGVKNDYFAGLLREWDPELIIMCCFGQKINRSIYDYPVFGMYNFHPSDLAANIGAGARPFESTIREGRTTSCMILHRVTERIDGGPIVGISPRINIALANDSYPDNFLVLQEKIPSACGWMTYGLLLSVLERKERGETEAVASIDFDRIIPEPVKQMLMEPVENDPLKIKKLPFPE
ncbi:MAG TPA: formyltransferase family protein [Bacteroidales bacterium]|nr:formyltransferase family protein [Bacteroidales bacterium]